MKLLISRTTSRCAEVTGRTYKEPPLHLHQIQINKLIGMHNPTFHDIKAKLVGKKPPPENQKGLILYHSPDVWTHKTSLTPSFFYCRLQFVIGTKKTPETW
jgi:hypothetical protein